MKISNNTILITGGGSGIGRGLAEALHAEGNHVIIAGRREGPLQETAAAKPGMSYQTLDINDASTIRAFAAQIVKDHPALNVVINNAGIMKAEELLEQPEDLADMEATITTNLLGPIRLIAALLPHLQQQDNAAIINVTSGLAFVPLALTPTYSATKAALHSYTQSLRHQLKETSVQVIELAPPQVGTELMDGGTQAPNAMPLDEYIAEVMDLLRNHPDADEICVERVKMLRNALANGNFDEVFARVNQARPT